MFMWLPLLSPGSAYKEIPMYHASSTTTTTTNYYDDDDQLDYFPRAK